MNKKVLASFALGIVVIATWGGNVLSKENKESKSEKQIDTVEEIYAVEDEQRMIPVEHAGATEEESIKYELSEEEEELGLKFVE